MKDKIKVLIPVILLFIFIVFVLIIRPPTKFKMISNTKGIDNLYMDENNIVYIKDIDGPIKLKGPNGKECIIVGANILEKDTNEFIMSTE